MTAISGGKLPLPSALQPVFTQQTSCPLCQQCYQNDQFTGDYITSVDMHWPQGERDTGGGGGLTKISTVTGPVCHLGGHSMVKLHCPSTQNLINKA